MAIAEFAHIGVDGAERQLAVEYRKLDDLVPYARNARTHSDAQVAEIAGSIRAFGFTNPVLIAEDGTLIAGHGRVLAARKLGMETVPTIVLAGLSETQRRALVLADNRIAMNAGWDEELLALELSDLQEAGFDLGLTGFGDDELQNLLYGSHRPCGNGAIRSCASSHRASRRRTAASPAARRVRRPIRRSSAVDARRRQSRAVRQHHPRPGRACHQVSDRQGGVRRPVLPAGRQ